MLELLYNFFSSLFNVPFDNYTGDSPMVDFQVAIPSGSDGATTLITYGDYFALICSWIALIFIVVLCFMFVFKIIKLVGGLIR